MSLRVLVCGSRGWSDWGAVRREMSKIPAGSVIVVGGCPKGADHMAEMVAGQLGFQVEVHRALWNKYGKRAGFVRNTQMVESGVAAVLAFHLGASAGTAHTVSEARKRGIPVRVIKGQWSVAALAKQMKLQLNTEEEAA